MQITFLSYVSIEMNNLASMKCYGYRDILLDVCLIKSEEMYDLSLNYSISIKQQMQHNCKKT